MSPRHQNGYKWLQKVIEGLGRLIDREKEVVEELSRPIDNEQDDALHLQLEQHGPQRLLLPLAARNGLCLLRQLGVEPYFR